MSDYFTDKTYRSKKDEVITMRRFMGLMPRTEIEIEKVYKDNLGMKLTIQAGPRGWTILWADKGSNFKDYDKEGDPVRTAEQNLEEALEVVKHHLGEVTEVTSGDEVEYCSCDCDDEECDCDCEEDCDCCSCAES